VFPRRFTYTVGRDDIAAAYMRFGAGPVSLWPVIALALIGDVALLFLLPDTLGDLAVVAAVSGVTAVAFGLTYAFRRWKIERRIARWSPEGETVVVLSGAGVSSTEGGRERRDDWSALPHVGRDDQRLYLVRGPGDALVLPLRAFDGPADMEDVFGRVRALMAGADDENTEPPAGARATIDGPGS
jgi:hypothetical protein